MLGRGELLVAVRLPQPAPAHGRRLPAADSALGDGHCGRLGAAVSLTLDAAGVCTAARVAIGAVAPTALLVPEAAAALVGTRLDAAALQQAAAAASAAARPIDDKRGTVAYRRQVVGVLTRRAAADRCCRARKGSMNVSKTAR